MGMVKKASVEHEITMEDFEAGLEWMTRYGVKTFKDHTGEWVEVRCSKEYDFWSPDPKPIAHLTSETA